jgi:hypothetical protein
MNNNPQTSDVRERLPVEQTDRDAAWPYRPACYRPEDRGRWDEGCYDVAVPVIQSFARHRLNALKAGGGNAV